MVHERLRTPTRGVFTAALVIVVVVVVMVVVVAFTVIVVVIVATLMVAPHTENRRQGLDGDSLFVSKIFRIIHGRYLRTLT